MIPDPVDIVYCEVCELPHRRAVAVCEECRHRLGTAPNWGQLRAEVAVERNKALVLAAATLVAGLSMIALVGRVWLAIIVGMMAWAIHHARRWLAISKQLAKQSAPPTRITTDAAPPQTESSTAQKVTSDPK
jgi:hypothetical protein